MDNLVTDDTLSDFRLFYCHAKQMAMDTDSIFYDDPKAAFYTLIYKEILKYQEERDQIFTHISQLVSHLPSVIKEHTDVARLDTLHSILTDLMVSINNTRQSRKVMPDMKR